MTPLPPPLTHCVVCTCILYTYSHREGGGEKWTRDKVRGATVHKAGSKILTWLTVYLQSIKLNIDKQLPHPLQVNFLRRRRFALVSMRTPRSSIKKHIDYDNPPPFPLSWSFYSFCGCRGFGYISHGKGCRKIRLIEGNAKCLHLKSALERDFAAAVYLSEAQKYHPRVTTDREIGCETSIGYESRKCMQAGLLGGHQSTPVNHKLILFPLACTSLLENEAPVYCINSLWVELEKMPLITFWNRFLGDAYKWTGLLLPLWQGVMVFSQFQL